MERITHLTLFDQAYDISVRQENDEWHVRVSRDGADAGTGRLTAEVDGDRVRITMNDTVHSYRVRHTDAGVWITGAGTTIFARHRLPGAERVVERAEGDVRAPMTGTLQTVQVAHGDAVTAGQLLGTMEAMKMEYRLEAPTDGRVAVLNGKAGEQIDVGTPLFRISPET